LTAGIGNVEDADLGRYAATITRLASRYDRQRTIPGHGSIQGDPVGHTLALTRRLPKQS
jgi:hypothetical protein